MNKLFKNIALILLVLSSAAIAQLDQPEIFLKTIPAGFQTVDIDDDGYGNNYVLGVRDGRAIIVKYDSSGNTVSDEDIDLGGITPIAFDVVNQPTGCDIYVVSSSRLVKYTIDYGTGAQSLAINRGLYNGVVDVTYAEATDKLFIAFQVGNIPPYVMVYTNEGASFQEYLVYDHLGWQNQSVRSIASDDQGNLYLVGNTGSNANSNWGGYRPNVSGSVSSNRPYIVKTKSDFTQYTLEQPSNIDYAFDVHFNNGWVYVTGSDVSDTELFVERFDTSLESSKILKVTNPSYSNLTPVTASNFKKFNVSADALDNIFLTGFVGAGTTKFYEDGSSDEFSSVATTGDSAYVAKLNSNFEYEWVKTPVQAPFPELGSHLRLNWDAVNSRLWWSGSFKGINGITMQEGADASTAKTLPFEISKWQGFTAVFEPDGEFTQVVDFSLVTDYAKNIVTINGSQLESADETLSLIVDSNITIRSPRTVYSYNGEDDGDKGLVEGAETSDINGEIGDKLIFNYADTRYSFINFSVNSVVEDSNATVYNFDLTQSTTVKLEWFVEYALEVDSYLDDTNSRATVSPNDTSYVPRLDSKASGNPLPSVGKHWIEKDLPVVMEINGAVENLTLHPGLAIRYVPWRYRLTGVATGNENAEPSATSSGTFETVEDRQQLKEFKMTGPATVTYDWKLQYGVSTNGSNSAADSQLLIEVVGDPPTPTTTQNDHIGGGLAWFDDSTVLKICAPRNLAVNSGLLEISGWFNGDNHIFSPTEGTFDTSQSNIFSADQLNDGFSTYTPSAGDFAGEEYVCKQVTLDRPAVATWNYGAKVIYKSVQIGEYIQFTAEEIAQYGLIVSQQPTLESSSGSGSDGVATSNDFIWDDVAKRFFAVRPIEMNLLWATTTGQVAKVNLTSDWGTPNYKYIANAPAVSLIPRPPVNEPNDLVFQSVAYTNAGGEVDDEVNFSANADGYTVLEFNRITTSGRGGTAQNVVELKVVRSDFWDTNLAAPISKNIGEKITSDKDLADLGTGYVFFPNARFNPYIYNRELFIGGAIWDEANAPGPVIAVNKNPTESEANGDLFVVLWYDDPSLNDYILWPYIAERYSPDWPANPGRILMSSGYGSESVAADGSEQNVVEASTIDGVDVAASTTFDPARFEQVQIYVQDNALLPGYNPNEEHALMAPSLRYAAVAPRPLAAYAMRDNDLNLATENASYTSHPYVLVQFLDKLENEFKMKVYQVVREDLANYPNGFSSEMEAGEPVIPFYPLGVVSGATLCKANYAKEGDPAKLVYWTDHKGTSWAVSGEGEFTSYFYYPLSTDFWWPGGAKSVGECVAWLPNNATARNADQFDIEYDKPDQVPAAQGVDYATVWPLDLPTIKVGETLTFAGGEYAADNPESPGLPGVLAWSAGEVIYDDLNPDMREGSTSTDGKDFDSYTARMISALEERRVSLPVALFPEELLPATGRTTVDGTVYLFDELSSSLKKRIFYNPLTGELGIKGVLNDKDISDDTLTAAPPAVYVLEPNILTQTEYDELLGTGDGSPFGDVNANENWRNAVTALFKLSRNPNQLTDNRITVGNSYTAGLQVQSFEQPDGSSIDDDNYAESYQAMGPGLALVTNPAFLDPNDSSLPDVSYITLAENNDSSLGGSPVILHVIKVDRRERYRGAIKVVLSDNVFDENIILRHTGDFGAAPDDLVFDWWYRVEDGTEALPPDQIAAGELNPWKLFPDPSDNNGVGFSQLALKGNPQAPELLLADSLWFVRYRHKDETPDDPISWERSPEIPYEWAGAGNSRPGDYQAQLAQGWVKRVLDAVNPYEARISDFTGDSPSTYASMIQQFGQRYEGPVALNPDKNVIENVGLIELYSTVLDRARSLSIDLSTPVSTPGITNALLLASTRLADFYMLLGNEAYTDAMDPTIGHGSDSASYGYLAPTVFTFQNQLSSKIEEELALLRGVDDYKARPVYNRLFWNFTKGEGEAAYATSYNISDVTKDGFINEDDAMVLYPQGHGDAWGHYLTAIGGQYALLNSPFFNWVSRSELYSLQDVVFEVDFLDERKFAQVAAAKAKAGAQIVDLSYRSSYVADPESQWQGYLDTDSERAWGVEGSARRAGQAAYFDWVTANALIPSVHPNSSKTGIEKVDRTTVKDIAVISANMNAIQLTYEQANNGYNPLGLAGNTVPFDIDPNDLGENASGASHFEQVYERAVVALSNAATMFDNANKIDNLLRNIENTEIDFRRSVFEEDMAYRNQLIEIFGTPYAGTIGSGSLYPAGYDGPDTSLYMYVDKQVREITADTVPGMTSGFESDIEDISDSFSDFTDTDYRANFAPSFSSNNPSDWFSNFDGVNYITTDSNGISFDSDSARVGLTNMQLPIKASGYTFEAPDSWGARANPGQLQLHISAMIQKEAELAKAIAAWDGFQGGVVRQLRLIAAQEDMDDDVRGLLAGKIANNTILGATIVGLKTAANVMDTLADLTPETAAVPSKFIPTTLPTAGFSFSPGDALAAARGALSVIGLGVEVTLKAGVVAANGVTDLAELTKDLIDMGLDYEIDDEERSFAMKQALVELENMVGDEGILRVEVYRQQEALRALSDEYRAILLKGARLIDEREAYNKRVAELVQRNRYQDMSFRVSRNAALARYREAFDLAARYAYLAAKAYDYETNLHADDAGSAQAILTDIVRERSIGYISKSTPNQGYGGLAESLADLKANYDVLKGQLGLNNPQAESGRFSLRRELYRISTDSSSDTNWRDQLAAKKVDNLWDLPEFRRYCRPFAAYDPAVAEPGLVIDFTSEIIAGKNFFGQALAGGDNAYDPTNFSTKIFSVGAWFEGYLSDSFTSGLSETPRVYLVPVGSDVMMYPSDNQLGVRMWDVLDQKIPVPYPVIDSNLDDNAWRPLDTLGGTDAEIRRFSSFRAYPDSGSFAADEMTFDTRLVGRSVWNTRWLLIIPGRTLKADADDGLQTFIDNVSDIKLYFQTYGFSGN
ncbi:hypothetical protein [Persicirhabdus sediminis]|uniref:Uncharacterized protein n=1 Tax=Persicirhabdus sediminis TaxID=454144 RepID=A0A8J7MG75_9BACT|nr:hypothetical protein [Persicirhabdus sediminis]MBK1791224.1 hypothetical protein [Persicirhabdus sediminis]